MFIFFLFLFVFSKELKSEFGGGCDELYGIEPRDLMLRKEEKCVYIPWEGNDAFYSSGKFAYCSEEKVKILFNYFLNGHNPEEDIVFHLLQPAANSGLWGYGKNIYKFFEDRCWYIQLYTRMIETERKFKNNENKKDEL